MSKLQGLILAERLGSKEKIPTKQVVIDAIKTFNVKKNGKVCQEDFVKGIDQMIQKLKDDIKRSHTCAKILAPLHQEPTIGELSG